LFDFFDFVASFSKQSYIVIIKQRINQAIN
jgi:hypothetical protein